MCICACVHIYEIASCVLTLLFDCPPNGFFGSPENLLNKSGECGFKILIFLSVRKMDEGKNAVLDSRKNSINKRSN